MDPTVNQIVSDVCANNGALLTQVIAWGAGAVGAASLLANFRKYLPPWLAGALDTLALNFVKEAAQRASQPPKGPAQ
jgi:hypothetical protein